MTDAPTAFIDHAFRRRILCAVGALMLLMLLAACSSGGQDPAEVTSLPEGNPRSGGELFIVSIDGAPPCSNCHSLESGQEEGASLAGYGALASSRVDGMSARGYSYQSIVQPAAFVVPGFSNLMYNQYGRKLSSQQIADLIAYLLTL
ncbi:MAG: c-type cytochrome [Anaerolineae bacterium]|nr:c-type cytochrome [Anaerolineae bacterium]NUQ03397.1 c-type cytochrome [Anaerolineae bacterium]